MSYRNNTKILVLKNKELKKDEFEIVSIRNNRFLGKVTVELRGKGKYGGTKKFSFKLKSRKIG